MSEELTNYLKGANIKVAFLHNEIKTLERMEIVRDLRLGKYDVVVGVNLLREGIFRNSCVYKERTIVGELWNRY